MLDAPKPSAYGLSFQGRGVQIWNLASGFWVEGGIPNSYSLIQSLTANHIIAARESAKTAPA